MRTSFLLFASLVTLGAGGPSSSLPKGTPTNTLCPVLGNKVNAKSPTVVVRGRTYAICCAGCDTQLLKSPDTYLEKDGRPKNAKPRRLAMAT